VASPVSTAVSPDSRARRAAAARAVPFAALAAAAPAAAAPWIVTPSAGLSAEYQSNPAYSVDDPSSTTQAAVNLSLPAEWRSGRWSALLNANATLRGTQGRTAGPDSSDWALGGGVQRASERLSFAANAGYARRDLLGGGVVDAGLDRSNGSETTTNGGVSVGWAITEYDSASASLTRVTRSFAAPADAGLIGSRDAIGSVSWSRALSPRLQFVVAAQRATYAPGGSVGRSTSTNLQAGLAAQPTEFWSLRATYGRSRARSDFSSGRISGGVYDVSASRRLEASALTLTANRALQSSAFGSVVEQTTYAATWSAPLAERLSATLSASRRDESEVFASFALGARRMTAASAGLSYALTETWSLSGTGAWSRESYPDTAFRRAVPSADSVGVTLGVSRRFGDITLFR
jgi:hypothetical protein